MPHLTHKRYPHYTLLETPCLKPFTMQKIGIIGLGYVGLPTAIGFLDAGFEVWGVDVSQRS
tara:strand:- start:454 stop:636 length:183 start_codon:yes stop_codon:yes gene_type:complete